MSLIISAISLQFLYDTPCIFVLSLQVSRRVFDEALLILLLYSVAFRESPWLHYCEPLLTTLD